MQFATSNGHRSNCKELFLAAVEDREPWVAVHVQSRREQGVALQLRYKGYEVFLPTYCSQAKGGAQPLFPGYLFCKFSQMKPANLIVTTPGVLQILGPRGKPARVSEEQVDSIRKIVTFGMPCRTFPIIEIGERVRIVHGPLAGLSGTLIRGNDLHTFVLSVDILHRAVAVHINGIYVTACR